jgi:hypothetical protein
MRSLERRNSQGHYVRPFEDWGKLIGDVPCATAILDRFLHHATVIAITGKSCRLRNQARGEASPAAETAKPAIPPAGSATSTKRKKTAAETAEACQPQRFRRSSLSTFTPAANSARHWLHSIRPMTATASKS